MNVEDLPALHVLIQILRCAAEAGATSVSIVARNELFVASCSDGKSCPRRIGVNVNYRFVRAIINRVKILSGMMLSVVDSAQVGNFALTNKIPNISGCRVKTRPTKSGEAVRLVFVS